MRSRLLVSLFIVLACLVVKKATYTMLLLMKDPPVAYVKYLSKHP